MQEMGPVSFPRIFETIRADRVVSTNNQLRTQLSQLQSTQHGSSAELSVIQLRIDVSFPILL